MRNTTDGRSLLHSMTLYIAYTYTKDVDLAYAVKVTTDVISSNNLLLFSINFTRNYYVLFCSHTVCILVSSNLVELTGFNGQMYTLFKGLLLLWSNGCSNFKYGKANS